MFQFEPVQLPHWVLREIHCCWVAELTLPSTSESDIQPPLDQPLSGLGFMPPRTSMRRRTSTRRPATACETTDCMTPLEGVIAKPSVPRQKFWVALSPERKASECRAPVMLTLSGEAPAPRICV